eukprot:3819704-Pyramimonas_sp.AAC.1
MERFVAACRSRGIPLHAGKSLVRAFRAGILGGELDRARGRLLRGREKSLRLGVKCQILAGAPTWSAGQAQH